LEDRIEDYESPGQWDVDGGVAGHGVSIDGTTPIVRGSQATFLYRGSAQSVGVASDSTGWRPEPMSHVDGVWSLTRTYPLDARDEYMLVVDGNWILDPLNPRRGPSPFGAHSECPMPGYRVRPIDLPKDGKMERWVMGDRIIEAYVPTQTHNASLLVVQDGYEYAWFTGLPGVLDGMIREGEIPPTLAVFVAPLDRDREYRPNHEYVDWVADELIPEVSRRYPIDPDPKRHGMVGCSLSGLIATYAALQRPDAIGLVGAQSPAYRGYIDRLIDEAEDVDWSALRVHVDGGTFEMTLYGRDFLPSIFHGAALLEERGCAVQYVESHEGHNWTNWRGRLPLMFRWLLGTPETL
jgi:enterochelin esterase family protein